MKLIACLFILISIANSNVDVSYVKTYKKSIVFISKNGQSPNGTGFLLLVDEVFHLVTAKHVVVKMMDGRISNFLEDQNMVVYLNQKNGTYAPRKISFMKDVLKSNWIFHSDSTVDVAIIPILIDPAKDDIKFIPKGLFLSSDKLIEMMDVFYISYQPGITFSSTISPIFRKGIVSALNSDKTFYMDGFAFPGNSGGPVFLSYSFINHNGQGFQMGGDKIGGSLVGLISGYLPYQEVAISVQTGRPRAVFEENSGLSKVIPIEFIEGILEKPEFKGQIARLRPKK